MRNPWDLDLGGRASYSDDLGEREYKPTEDKVVGDSIVFLKAKVVGQQINPPQTWISFYKNSSHESLGMLNQALPGIVGKLGDWLEVEVSVVEEKPPF